MGARVRWTVVVACVTLAACGGGDTPSPSPSSSTTIATPTPTATQEPRWPLTGRPADSAPDTPALVVKVDNTSAAAPQVGLSSADLVVEQLVEGGQTRLAAMFQSRLPDAVGPVRSVRTTDIGIAAPAGGVLAASGGAGRVLEMLDDAGLRVLGTGDAGFSRAPDRSAPYDVMLDTAAAGASIEAPAGVPERAYLPWGRAPEGRPVTRADVAFSGAHTTRWAWTGRSWSMRDDLAADGDEFAPTTIVILRVTTRDAGYTDPAGNPVPETVLTGGGAAVLLHNGMAVDGRWAKSGLAAPLRLTGTDGEALRVPAGRTWIELVPESGDVQLSSG